MPQHGESSLVPKSALIESEHLLEWLFFGPLAPVAIRLHNDWKISIALTGALVTIEMSNVHFPPFFA